MTAHGPEKFRGHYSETGFREKLAALPLRVGRALVLQALTLYVLLTSSETPASAKLLVAGALGYLIMPFDAVPDFVPVLGFVDDGTVMALVLDRLREHVTPEVRARAERLLPARFHE